MRDSDTTPVPEPSAAGQPDPDGGTNRGWKVAAIIAVIAAAIALGVLGSLLFFDGGAKTAADVRACQPVRDFTTEGADERAKGDACPPPGATMTDGLVQKTDDGGFTMRAIRAGKLAETVTLHVREPDRPYIDIAHAQTHAALGQPIRVFTEEIDGRESVVYMEDAPLLK